MKNLLAHKWKLILLGVVLVFLGKGAELLIGKIYEGREKPLPSEEEMVAALQKVFQENEASIRRQLEEDRNSAFSYYAEEASANPLTITYTYKIKEGFDVAKLNMEAGRRDIETTVCKTPQMEPLRRAGTIFRYVYLNRDNKVFFEFDIRSKTDCK